MNQRYALVLALLALVVGGAALYMYRREESAQPALAAQLGQPLIKNLEASEVASIVIRAPQATLTLARKAGHWTLAERNGFPADLNKVTDLVLKAIELKIGRAEAIGEQDRARLALLDPAKSTPPAGGSATSLTFKAADGRVLAQLLVGKKYFKNAPTAASADTPADGRFVMLPGHPQQVVIVSDPLRLVSAASADWVSKDGIAVEHVKSLEVKPAEGEGYKIERSSESADWKLANAKSGEKLDQTKANAAAYKLGRLEIDDVAAGDQAGDKDFDHPAVITATTFDGLTYVLHLGQPEDERYRLRVEVEGTPRREPELRKDEKPEAKAAREKALAEEMKRLDERVAREKALKDYVLLVAKSKLADLPQKKADLLQRKPASPAKP